jgi:hypothetical protein
MTMRPATGRDAGNVAVEDGQSYAVPMLAVAHPSVPT